VTTVTCRFYGFNHSPHSGDRNASNLLAHPYICPYHLTQSDKIWCGNAVKGMEGFYVLTFPNPRFQSTEAKNVHFC